MFLSHEKPSLFFNKLEWAVCTGSTGCARFLRRPPPPLSKKQKKIRLPPPGGKGREIAKKPHRPCPNRCLRSSGPEALAGELLKDRCGISCGFAISPRRSFPGTSTSAGRDGASPGDKSAECLEVYGPLVPSPVVPGSGCARAERRPVRPPPSNEGSPNDNHKTWYRPRRRKSGRFE